MFERLKDKSTVMQGHIAVRLRADFTPDDVPFIAQETAGNWFYKVSFCYIATDPLFMEIRREVQATS